MKKWRRRICFGLAVLQCMTGMAGVAGVYDDTVNACYGTVDFSKPEEIEGMTMVLNQQEYVTKGGRRGIQLGSVNTNWIMYFNVNDKIAYELPDETPIAITVEYFDEGNGFFEIAYDGYRVSELRVPKTGFDRIGIWNNTEPVHMTNTGEWKTHTFYMDDIRMANRVAGADFRVATWTISSGISPEEVVIGSIKVEEVEHRNPLRVVETKTNQPGNIYGDGEDMGMEFVLRNRAKEEVRGRIVMEITDENGNEVYSKEETKTFPAETDTGYSAKFPVEKYGIYYLKVSIYAEYPERPEKKTMPLVENYEFSKAWKVPKDRLNTRFGTQLGTATLKWSAEDGVGAKLAADAGIGWAGEEVMWRLIETVPGKYQIPERADYEMDLTAKEGMNLGLGLIYNNPLYWNGQMINDPPSTAEELNMWGNWVEWLAKETKGQVGHFRVWNEYNWKSFNVNNDPPEHYIELLKVAWDRVKKQNPDAILSGMETAGINHEFNRRVFETGALDYMDVVAVHPYDWSGHFDTRNLIRNSEILKEMLAEYGHPDKPIWWTEMGFGQGYALPYQAACFVMTYCLAQCYDIADVIYQFRLQNDDIHRDPTDGEAVWGLLWHYLDEGRENGAKPSYLAIAAMNNLIGIQADPNGVIQDGTNYAFRFYNNDMQKDVAVLMGEYDNNYMTFDLGTTQAEVYDMYGNKLWDIASDNGIYSFVVNQVPIYVAGKFEKFEQKENSCAKFYPVNFETNVVAGEAAEFLFRETVDNNLKVVVEDNEFIVVEKNDGFQNGEAKVVLRTSKEIPEWVNIGIQLVDEFGKVAYSGSHSIRRIEPILIDISSELAVKGSDHWKAKVLVTNQSQTTTVSGIVQVIGPENVKKTAKVRKFTKVRPGESIELHLNLPTQIIKQNFDLEVEVTLENGYSKRETKTMDFSSAAYAVTKPVIDGVREDKEWHGNWFGANEERLYSTDNYIGWETWNGPDDASFAGLAMWDETDFYLLMYAVDDVHHVANNGGVANLWQTDSIQFAVDDRDDDNPVGKDVLNELGVAEVPGYGVLAWRYNSIYGLPIGKQVTNCEIAMKRYDGYTIYECRIPWTEAISESFVPAAGRKIRFSAVLNDSDSVKSRGWMMYNGGITPNKNVDLLGYMELLDK